MIASPRANPLVKGNVDADRTDAVMARIASQLATSVANTISEICNETVEVAAAPTGIISFAEWRSERSLWEASYQFGSKLAMVVAVNDALADAMVERRFGGTSQIADKVKFKACSATAKLAGQFSDCVASAITLIFPTIGRAEVLPAIAVQQFARSSDRIATIALRITAPGNISGSIDIAFAPERVARLRDDDADQPTSNWTTDLRTSVLSARMPLRVVFARPELPVFTLKRLAVGDVIPITKPAVQMLAGALRLATGAIENRDGHAAIRIQHLETEI